MFWSCELTITLKMLWTCQWDFYQFRNDPCLGNDPCWFNSRQSRQSNSQKTEVSCRFRSPFEENWGIHINCRISRDLWYFSSPSKLDPAGCKWRRLSWSVHVTDRLLAISWCDQQPEEDEDRGLPEVILYIKALKSSINVCLHRLLEGAKPYPPIALF